MSPAADATSRLARFRVAADRSAWRAPALLLGAIMAFGLALRLYAALNPSSDPGQDAETYRSIAAAIFTDGSYGSDTMKNASDWSPLAPLVVSCVYFVAGGVHPEAARVVIAILTTGTVALAFLIGRRLAGDRAALVGAFLVAVYPAFIDYAGFFSPEPIAALTVAGGVLGFMWAWGSGGVWRWFVPGLLFGITVLGRPEYLALAVPFAVAVMARETHLGRLSGRADSPLRSEANRTSSRRGPAGPALGYALLATAVFLVAYLVPVVPWTARNYVALDRFVPVTTGGGKALFEATYLPGQGRHLPTKRALLFKYPDLRKPKYRGKAVVSDVEVYTTPMAPLLDRVASKYPAMERDAALGRIGRENLVEYVTSRPVAYGKMTVRKAWNVWRRGSGQFMRPHAWEYFQLALYPFALLGIAVLGYRRRWEIVAPLIPMVGITILGALLLAVPRRNVSVMPLVLVFTGCGVSFACSWLWRAVRRPRSGDPGSAVSYDFRDVGARRESTDAPLRR